LLAVAAPAYPALAPTSVRAFFLTPHPSGREPKLEHSPAGSSADRWNEPVGSRVGQAWLLFIMSIMPHRAPSVRSMCGVTRIERTFCLF
jgi:hypothetical protein